jgi:hypothetical protein
MLRRRVSVKFVPSAEFRIGIYERRRTAKVLHPPSKSGVFVGRSLLKPTGQLFARTGVSYSVEVRKVELGKRAVSAGVRSALVLAGLALVGCDDNVEVLRDPSVRITRGMTWAWRPNAPRPVNAVPERDGRKVISRDVITPAPQQHMESNRDWNNGANRNMLQQAIERGLKDKGLVQVSDPATADLLVDYHVAVKGQQATVGTVYPGGWGWGWGWWGPPEVEYQTVRWHQGTFVLDLALRNPKTLAYRAIGHRELNNKSTISPYQAESAVGHLLKGLQLK